MNLLLILSFISLFPTPSRATHVDIDFVLRKDTSLPRTVHVCAALLANAGVNQTSTSESTPALRSRLRALRTLLSGADHTARTDKLDRFLRKLDRVLSPHRQVHVAARQIFVGEEAISAHLNAVGETVRTLEAAFDPTIANEPISRRPRFAVYGGWSALAALATGGLFYGADQLLAQDHGTLALGVVGYASWIMVSKLAPSLRGVFYNLVSARRARSAEWRSNPVLARAGILRDPKDPRFAIEVREALGRAPDSGSMSYTYYRVALPMSLSMVTSRYDRRTPPTAVDVIGATRRSGSFPLPPDYRVFEVFRLFYYDEALRPVLVTLVREPRSSSDWIGYL